MDDENIKDLHENKNTVDISMINLKNENLKLRNKKAEKDLLSSISENGIQEPLLGFYDKDIFVLVDGFKRLRCCKKLHITSFPFEIIANDEVSSFIKIIKTSNSKSLHILEQAKLIDNLQKNHNMTASAIAMSLEKSNAWVLSRLTLLKEISLFEEDKIFKGTFPVWCSMGVLHKIKRSAIASNDEVDEFIKSVSGKGLSVKDIDLLANGYFKGGDELKTQIKNGNLSWSINKLKDYSNQEDGQDTLVKFNDDEKRLLKDLEIASKYIGRLIFKLPQIKKNKHILSTAGILTEGILDKLDRFQLTLKTFIEEVKNDQ
jgi:ParB/RepB/Spo0J family partition protein